jgi:diguanylate cyclase
MTDMELEQPLPRAVEEWREISGEISEELRIEVARLIDSHKEALANRFYETMLSDAEAAPFLGHELINERLRFSLQNWLSGIFRADGGADLSEAVAMQKKIGLVHARIHVPIHVVMRGARVLKRDIAVRFEESGFPPDAFAKAMAYCGNLIDLAMEIASSAYVAGTARNVRTDEAYRLFSLSQNISVERERQRAALLEWGHQLLFALYGGKKEAVVPIGSSAFGLWLHHKANVVFEGAPEILRIQTAMNRIDFDLIEKLGQAEGNAIAQGVSEIERALLEIKYLLTTLFDRYLEIENARDVLTRLLNRRFLPSILAREIAIANQQKSNFAVLLVDIDRFKEINDNHGHDAGDMVLQQSADLILGLVRSGDFVFRYGGEEILIVLVEVTPKAALNVAETIRCRFASTPFKVEGEKTIPVTVSIGVASFDGHPDYDHLISLADNALYRAKDNGRNRCETSFKEA